MVAAPPALDPPSPPTPVGSEGEEEDGFRETLPPPTVAAAPEDNGRDRCL